MSRRFILAVLGIVIADDSTTLSLISSWIAKITFGKCARIPYNLFDACHLTGGTDDL
uniref:Lipoprotein signal peptidase n=1 Tax=Echinococcus granulosus TaxID=6210 RepID=A0A068X279_ECHGR|nr:hypothetical protein EgrG_000315500 [Echinococcus granulosus]